MEVLVNSVMLSQGIYYKQADIDNYRVKAYMNMHKSIMMRLH